MAITLEQVNAVLDVEVSATNLRDALNYALGIYRIPLTTLNADEPHESLILGIALLAEQAKAAPFAAVATAALKSTEISLDDAGSIKETFADAPTEQFPMIAGILDPFRVSSRPGIGFGVSCR